jgi:predicted nucleic acid-binding protein
MSSGVFAEKISSMAIEKVVVDAGPIIHLDEIDCLNLLSDFNEIYVPEVVWKEAEHHRPFVIDNSSLPFIKTPVSEDKSPNIILFCNAFNLDEGERHAIILSLQQQSIILTDDAAARIAAKSLGLRTHGTIGILLRSIRRKQLTPQAVIDHLIEIPDKSTLFIKKNILTEIINQVKNEYKL